MITSHENYGDSLSSAFPPSPNDLCVKIVADHFSRALNNRAQGGAQAADQSYLCYGVTPVDTTSYSVLTGFNDVYNFGTDAVKFGNGFIPCHMANVAHLAMPNKVSARSMYDAHKFGAWTDSGFNTGIGMHNSNPQIGDALAFSNISGKLICIFGAIHDAVSSEGVANVLIDNVIVGQIAMKGYQIGATALGSTLTMGCWPFRVADDGPHLVQVIATNNKTLFIDQVAGSGDQLTLPQVIVGDLSRRHPLITMDPVTALYNAAITTNTYLLRSAGLNVHPAYISKVVDPVEDVLGDDVPHWGLTGQQHVGAELIRAMGG